MTTIQKIIQFVAEHNDQLAQALNKTVLGQPDATEEMMACCRRAGAEGIVLLKNDGVLPLKAAEETAFFGRIQNDWFYVGYGSGGDVNPHYLVSPMAALQSRGDVVYNRELAQVYQTWSAAHVPFEGVWGLWPTHFDEMPLTQEQVKKAAATSQNAVVFLGRAMGESLDNKPKKGWYYLTEEEIRLLDQVTAIFDHTVVVIDAGNIIDMGWMERYGDKLGAVLYAFQGGMESGNALLDVLYGDVNPSSRLTDTIARTYEDYPATKNFGGLFANHYREDIYVGYRYFETFARDRVLYPFGFGLSYTTFRLETSCLTESDRCVLETTVTNTGDRPGAQVVQVYVNPPQGKLGKPLRNLVAFRKTRTLTPGEAETLRFELSSGEFASFDDSGATGHPNCYVLEPGVYELYVGTDVRSAALAGQWETERLRVIRQLREQAAPVKPFRRLKSLADGTVGTEPVPLRTTKLKDDILENLPREIPYTGDQGIKLQDVKQGKATLDAFVAQLDIGELDAITRGEGDMRSSFGAPGNAGMLGGTTQSLRDKGIPPIITTDGPSGIRVFEHAALLPCGTALACGWNPELIEELGRLFGEEMIRKGSDILLGPGMNIHRDPMCGRNFEYYSEDPYLTGKIAAAMVRGIQRNPSRSACPKHFACNNQEKMRSRNDSRLSQRALREIYLRGFEICVRESAPKTIMTSYNRINGIWGHYHYELVTNILRGEWGYEGLVITDWWMQPATDPNFPALKNDAYRVSAQVDVLMPGGVRGGQARGDGSLERSYQKPDGITLGQMQRCAKNVLNFILKLK